MVKDKDEQEQYLMSHNSALFFELRGAVVTADAWEQGNGKCWPSTDLTTSSRKVRATALIGPEPGGKALSDTALMEWQARVADFMLNHLDPLNADILDCVNAIFLERCSSPEQMTIIRADDLLRFRGLQPRGRAYWTEQRQKIADRMALLSSTWIDLHEMETIVQDKNGRRRTKVQKIRSRAIVVSSVAEETTTDGTTVYAWKVRPGDVFAPFLLGPGKQLALLSRRLLELDPYRCYFEKMTGRYILFLARVRQKNGDYLKPIRVRSILDAIKKTVDQRNPRRTRHRLEEALNRLAEDHVVQSWHYEDQDAADRSQSAGDWLDSLIVVEMPQAVLDQYQKIALPPAPSSPPPTIDASVVAGDLSVIARMKARRLVLELSQLQLAKALGLNGNYLAKLERGVSHPSERLASAIEGWLSEPRDSAPTE